MLMLETNGKYRRGTGVRRQLPRHRQAIRRRHRLLVAEHIQAPLRRIIQAEANLTEDAQTVQPTLLEMRRLNQRSLRILAIAEESKDHDAALGATVRAADSVMSHAAKAIEIEDIEARVSELERAAEAQTRQ